MKTIKLTLAMAALALGATAFAFSGHTDPVKPVKETTYYYANQGGGNYVQIPAPDANPSEHCFDTDPNYCILQSSTSVTSFTLGQSGQPSVSPVPGSNLAIYQ